MNNQTPLVVPFPAPSFRVHIDFEFNKTKEEFVNLVCMAIIVYDHKAKKILFKESVWIHKNLAGKERAVQVIQSFRNIPIFGYSLVAECRSFLALGLNILDFVWEDGFLEYRMLTNHNDDLIYGKQLRNGKVITATKPPPKWERTEEDNKTAFKPTHSLAECTFKLLGVTRDTEHKDAMRDLIISAPEDFTEEQQTAITDYCMEDVIYLPKIRDALVEQYRDLGFLVDDEFIKEMQWRGRYSAHTAHMENDGYPINIDWTRRLTDAIPHILTQCQREINNLFPDVMPFKWKPKEQKYSMDTKAIKEWLRNNAPVNRWMKTDGYKVALSNEIKKQRAIHGKLSPALRAEIVANYDVVPFLSLALEAWTQHFNFQHDYPKDNFGAQMVRYLKLKQNLNGFTESAKTGSFWDNVGSDGRVRPYFNHYGSQSSRSQPASKGFLFLKPAWMRSLAQAPAGRAIGSIDYGSQEFFISALDSECQNMIDAYLSGDVYMAFAILSKMVPSTATKVTHKLERQIAKQIILAMSYLMTAIGLANALSLILKRVVTEEEAQEYIDLFYDSYYELGEYQKEIQEIYKNEGFLQLPDGWMMLGDNDNFRSVTNFPIQGKGACIMRKAVDLFNERKGKLCPDAFIILTLHDALYIEFDSDKPIAMRVLRDAMIDAFAFFYPDREREARQIKLDPYAWSVDYKKDSSITVEDMTFECTDIYIDERSANEYEEFKEHFQPTEDYL